MRTTKRWGFVNSTAQEYMLNHAERTRKKIERKKKRESSKRKHRQD